MTGQDNETFESRVTTGVFEAVFEAGRMSPGGDPSLDIRKTLDALSGAVASFASTMIALTESEEAAAAEIERQGVRLAELMTFLAAKVRAGELVPLPAGRPKPRLVD